MTDQEIFNIKYCDNPRFVIMCTYADGSVRSFDNEDWDTFKDGIKKNLYDNGKVRVEYIKKEYSL